VSAHAPPPPLCRRSSAETERSFSVPTVEFVYKHDPAAINVPDSRGQTPLHLAAALDRRDVLALFLAQDDTDDMIRDQTGKTCFEVAATPEAASQISGN
jgi:ankyrin repeat protein